MLEYIHTHLGGFWISAGFFLLILEVLLFGFSTIIFFFAGMAAVTTGVMLQFEIIESSWIASVSSFGLFTGVYSLLLYRPMKKFQSDAEPEAKPHSDLIGLEFSLQQEINSTNPGKYRYSGIDWQVVPDSSAGSLQQGSRVKVVNVSVGKFAVAPVDSD